MKGFGIITFFIGIITTIVGACMLGFSTDYKIQKEVLDVEKVDNDLYGFFNVSGLKFKKQITEGVYEKFLKTKDVVVDLEFSGYEFNRQTDAFYLDSDEVYNNSDIVDGILVVGIILIAVGFLCSGILMHLDIFSLLFLID